MAYQELGTNGGIELSGIASQAVELSAAIRSANLADLSVTEFNAISKSLCRLLIPVNYSQHGPYHHDLAVETRPLPGLMQLDHLGRLDPTTDDWHFLRAKLVRERNRIEHAIRSAARQFPS